MARRRYTRPVPRLTQQRYDEIDETLVDYLESFHSLVHGASGKGPLYLWAEQAADRLERFGNRVLWTDCDDAMLNAVNVALAWNRAEPQGVLAGPRFAGGRL